MIRFGLTCLILAALACGNAGPEPRRPAATSSSSQGDSQSKEASVEVPAATALSPNEITRTCKVPSDCKALCEKQQLAEACYQHSNWYFGRFDQSRAVDDAIKSVEYGEKACAVGTAEMCRSAANSILAPFIHRKLGVWPEAEWRARQRGLFVKGCEKLPAAAFFRLGADTNEANKEKYFHEWLACRQAGQSLTAGDDPDAVQAQKYLGRIGDVASIELHRYKILWRNCQPALPQGKKACEDAESAIAGAIEQNTAVCADDNSDFRSDDGRCVEGLTRRSLIRWVVCKAVTPSKCVGASTELLGLPKGYSRIMGLQ